MRKPRKARNPVARHLRESGNYRSQVVRPRKGTGSYKRCETKGRRPDARRDGGFDSGARISGAARVTPQRRRGTVGAAAACCSNPSSRQFIRASE